MQSSVPVSHIVCAHIESPKNAVDAGYGRPLRVGEWLTPVESKTRFSPTRVTVSRLVIVD